MKDDGVRAGPRRVDPPVIPVSHIPLRTCLGCRRRVPATELLRVIATPGASTATSSDVARALVPDQRRRAGGRGAWVHPVIACLQGAERRRAFARALRVPGALDPAAVWAFVANDEAPATDSRPVVHELSGD